MENSIQIYTHEEFGRLRVKIVDGNPWFSAPDTCNALNISNVSQALTRLDDDEKMTLRLNECHSGQRGGAQMMNFVSEPGLYHLIFQSRKPEARHFQRWVYHDVILAIYKTGVYINYNAKMQASVETNLQRASLIIRAAEYKAMPQSEQLRLLNIAVKDLTGTELNLTQISTGEPPELMTLPEIFGTIKRSKAKKIGKYTFRFYPMLYIADSIGIAPAKFNEFADAHGMKHNCNGIWERVKIPQGEAREFMYLESVIAQYHEEAK